MTSPRVGATATSNIKADLWRASFSVYCPLKKRDKRGSARGVGEPLIFFGGGGGGPYHRNSKVLYEVSKKLIKPLSGLNYFYYTKIVEMNSILTLKLTSEKKRDIYTLK